MLPLGRVGSLDMSDEDQTSMSVPLDRDGFLRRECPTCEQEFKVFAHQGEGEEAEAQNPQPGGYFCPYCAIQAQPDAWFTKAQLAKARSILMEEFVGPKLQNFKRGLDGTSGVSVDLQLDHEPAAELTESDDMRRVAFACHPQTPVKIGEEYWGEARCFICGEPAKPAS